jgi:ribosomal protein S27AE
MDEYISRKAAIDACFNGWNNNAHDCAENIRSIPAADVRAVVKGKWTMHSDFPDRLICSKCGTQFDVWHWEAKQMHFCPNCGADMREES